MRSLILVIAGVTAVFLAEHSDAAEHGFYIGGAVGQTRTEEKFDFGNFFDDRDSSYKIMGGFRPFDWFAIEGSYFDFGDVTLNQDTPDLSPFRLSQRGYGAFGMFLWEFTAIDLFAKTGIIRSSADTRSNSIIGPLNFTDRDTDYAWGFGGQMRFGKLATRLEYERFHISNGDGFETPRSLTFGLTWALGDD
jgi:hypothetical protein